MKNQIKRFQMCKNIYNKQFLIILKMFGKDKDSYLLKA